MNSYRLVGIALCQVKGIQIKTGAIQEMHHE